jgi:glutamate carboxypeptidase
VREDARRIIGKRVVPDTNVTVDVTLLRPPFVKNELTERLVTIAQRVYRELDRTLEPVTMGFGTDAGFAFQPGSSKPAVLEGMGIVGGGLHAPEEWAELDSIAPRLYLTVRMLELLGATSPVGP